MHAYNLRFGPATTLKQRQIYQQLYASLDQTRDQILSEAKLDLKKPPSAHPKVITDFYGTIRVAPAPEAQNPRSEAGRAREFPSAEDGLRRLDASVVRTPRSRSRSAKDGGDATSSVIRSPHSALVEMRTRLPSARSRFPHRGRRCEPHERRQVADALDQMRVGKTRQLRA